MIAAGIERQAHRVRVQICRKRLLPLIQSIHFPVTDKPDRSVRRAFQGADIALQDSLKAVVPAVETLQPMVGRQIQPSLPVRRQESHAPRPFGLLAGDKPRHVFERIAAETEDGIGSAEPKTSQAVGGDAVDSTVIRGFRQGVETDMRRLGVRQKHT